MTHCININELVFECFKRSKDAGWYTDPHTNKTIDRNVAEMLCLIHSEISEALEGHRKRKMDDHLPNRKSIEVELADALIRICDLAGYLQLDLGGAVDDKMAYNLRRTDHKLENRAKDGGKLY